MISWEGGGGGDGKGPAVLHYTSNVVSLQASNQSLTFFRERMSDTVTESPGEKTLKNIKTRVQVYTIMIKKTYHASTRHTDFRASCFDFCSELFRITLTLALDTQQLEPDSNCFRKPCAEPANRLSQLHQLLVIISISSIHSLIILQLSNCLI